MTRSTTSGHFTIVDHYLPTHCYADRAGNKHAVAKRERVAVRRALATPFFDGVEAEVSPKIFVRRYRAEIIELRRK